MGFDKDQGRYSHIMGWTDGTRIANPDEWRAAAMVAPEVGVLPRLEDDNSKPGMVDLVFTGLAGLELIEVSSTVDGDYAEDHRIVLSYLDAVQEAYDGRGRWVFGFGREWKPIRRQPRDVELAVEALKDLEAGIEGKLPSGKGVSFGAPKSFGFQGLTLSLYEYPSDKPSVDYSLSTRMNFQGSYAFVLQDFLDRSDLIKRKVEKLVRESARLGGSRHHLFLLVPAAGLNGHLLPIRSVGEVWAAIELPEGLDVLWLDGGTGLLAMFARDSGWSFFDR